MTSATPKTAIVTGASRGIGAVVSERLAKDGFNLIINYAGNAAEAQAVVTRIETAGGHAISVQADVSDPAAMRRMFDAAEAAFGGVDVLVNNAGIMPVANIADFSDEQFDRCVAINLKGVFNGMREAARRMRNGGRVISSSSSVVGIYQPAFAVYAATKGAVEAMSHVFSKELRGRNITVNVIAPGPIATDLTKAQPKEALDHLAHLSPLERLGEPAEIADVVAFLAGPGGGWINGQVLRVNGGVV